MKNRQHPKDYHKNHEQELVIVNTGPHKGMWVCKQCKRKWVRWASTKEIKQHETR